MSGQTTLDDALQVVIDHRGKTPKKLGGDWSVSGHRVVSALNIKGSRVDENDHHYVDDVLYAKWMKEPLRRGDVLLTSEAPLGEVAYLSRDVDWCLGQRLFGLRADPSILDGRFLFYLLRGGPVRDQLFARATGSTVSGIRQSELLKIELDLPSLKDQREIAATLGALDDKIHSNAAIRKLLRSLGLAHLDSARAKASTRSTELRGLTQSISRGVTPKYSEEAAGSTMVLNQKCIRDGWVNIAQARLMVERAMPEAKRVVAGDILINSTGVGTLGRVGRWHSGLAAADSHVSIVKPNAEVVGPTVLAYSLFGREVDIEAMATGSTGQTELSPDRLGELIVSVPTGSNSSALEATLIAIENKIDSLRIEEELLERTRDALLPELLAGRMHASETTEVVS